MKEKVINKKLDILQFYQILRLIFRFFKCDFQNNASIFWSCFNKIFYLLGVVLSTDLDEMSKNTTSIKNRFKGIYCIIPFSSVNETDCLWPFPETISTFLRSESLFYKLFNVNCWLCYVLCVQQLTWNWRVKKWRNVLNLLIMWT